MNADRCCFLCRTPFGTCVNRACDHHITYEKQAARDHKATRTHRDPTGDQAIARVMRERRKK